MKREILFRGARVCDGHFVNGSLVEVNGECDSNESVPHIVISYGPDTFDWFEVDPETVGQFTGMTDKHGTKIFEGDILKFNTFRTKNTGGRKDIVRFEDCGFYPMNDLFYIDGECGDSIELDKDGNYMFEIIGNIYDKKELLK